MYRIKFVNEKGEKKSVSARNFNVFLDGQILCNFGARSGGAGDGGSGDDKKKTGVYKHLYSVKGAQGESAVGFLAGGKLVTVDHVESPSFKGVEGGTVDKCGYAKCMDYQDGGGLKQALPEGENYFVPLKSGFRRAKKEGSVLKLKVRKGDSGTPVMIKKDGEMMVAGMITHKRGDTAVVAWYDGKDYVDGHVQGDEPVCKPALFLLAIVPVVCGWSLCVTDKNCTFTLDFNGRCVKLNDFPDGKWKMDIDLCGWDSHGYETKGYLHNYRTGHQLGSVKPVEKGEGGGGLYECPNGRIIHNGSIIEGDHLPYSEKKGKSGYPVIGTDGFGVCLVGMISHSNSTHTYVARFNTKHVPVNMTELSNGTAIVRNITGGFMTNVRGEQGCVWTWPSHLGDGLGDGYLKYSYSNDECLSFCDGAFNVTLVPVGVRGDSGRPVMGIGEDGPCIVGIVTHSRGGQLVLQRLGERLNIPGDEPLGQVILPSNRTGPCNDGIGVLTSLECPRGLFIDIIDVTGSDILLRTGFDCSGYRETGLCKSADGDFRPRFYTSEGKPLEPVESMGDQLLFYCRLCADVCISKGHLGVCKDVNSTIRMLGREEYDGKGVGHKALVSVISKGDGRLIDYAVIRPSNYTTSKPPGIVEVSFVRNRDDGLHRINGVAYNHHWGIAESDEKKCNRVGLTGCVLVKQAGGVGPCIDIDANKIVPLCSQHWKIYNGTETSTVDGEPITTGTIGEKVVITNTFLTTVKYRRPRYVYFRNVINDTQETIEVPASFVVRSLRSEQSKAVCEMFHANDMLTIQCDRTVRVSQSCTNKTTLCEGNCALRLRCVNFMVKLGNNDWIHVGLLEDGCSGGLLSALCFINVFGYLVRYGLVVLGFFAFWVLYAKYYKWRNPNHTGSIPRYRRAVGSTTTGIIVLVVVSIIISTTSAAAINSSLADDIKSEVKDIFSINDVLVFMVRSLVVILGFISFWFIYTIFHIRGERVEGKPRVPRYTRAIGSVSTGFIFLVVFSVVISTTSGFTLYKDHYVIENGLLKVKEASLSGQISLNERTLHERISLNPEGVVVKPKILTMKIVKDILHYSVQWLGYTTEPRIQYFTYARCHPHDVPCPHHNCPAGANFHKLYTNVYERLWGGFKCWESADQCDEACVTSGRTGDTSSWADFYSIRALSRQVSVEVKVEGLAAQTFDVGLGASGCSKDGRFCVNLGSPSDTFVPIDGSVVVYQGELYDTKFVPYGSGDFGSFGDIQSRTEYDGSTPADLSVPTNILEFETPTKSDHGSITRANVGTSGFRAWKEENHSPFTAVSRMGCQMVVDGHGSKASIRAEECGSGFVSFSVVVKNMEFTVTELKPKIEVSGFKQSHVGAYGSLNASRFTVDIKSDVDTACEVDCTGDCSPNVVHLKSGENHEEFSIFTRFPKQPDTISVCGVTLGFSVDSHSPAGHVPRVRRGVIGDATPGAFELAKHGFKLYWVWIILGSSVLLLLVAAVVFYYYRYRVRELLPRKVAKAKKKA